MTTPRTRRPGRGGAPALALCAAALASGCAGLGGDALSRRGADQLAQLSSPDASVRAAAEAALVAIGPRALRQVCPFIRRHLDDAAEGAWRAAYRVEEQIALRYQDDPHLDDYYRSLKPVGLPAKFVALPGGVRMELVRIPAGRFIQGSANPGTGVPLAIDMPCNYAPVRKVTISRPFWIGRDEVTQGQWEALMGFNRCRDKRPHLAVDRVSWDEAMKFCRRLSALDPPAEFTLPTEAQWEYACRAQTTSRNAFGNRSRDRGDPGLAEGGPFWENRWGLRHMHDGVFEWCLDWFGPYTEAAATDPTGPITGQTRSIRSNYTYCSAAEFRCAHRVGFPSHPRHGIGLRVVCPAR